MALPLSYMSMTLADNTVKSNGEPETTSTIFPVVTMTPANAAAQVTLQGNLRAAIAAVVLGNFLKNEVTYVVNRTGNGPSADPLAQRENKWLFRYHDPVTFQKSSLSVGTADLTAKIANSEFIDLTAGDGLALKTAFEAVVVSPYDAANMAVLDSVQFVGRNT